MADAFALDKRTAQMIAGYFFLISFLLLAGWRGQAIGQQKNETEELAKKTQNPVADLISVPLENNFNWGTGYRQNKLLYVLNVQPVIPWNSIKNGISSIALLCR